MIVLGHVIDYVVLMWVRDLVTHHVLLSQGHVPVSQSHVGRSLSLLFGYSLALGAGLVDLGLSRAIPSLGGVVRAKPTIVPAHVELSGLGSDP